MPGSKLNIRMRLNWKNSKEIYDECSIQATLWKEATEVRATGCEQRSCCDIKVDLVWSLYPTMIWLFLLTPP